MTKEVKQRKIESYQSEDGKCVFAKWFDNLPAQPAAKVTKALTKLGSGLGDQEPVGGGVSELRMHWGPGYRIYFGQDGETLVILLCGGTKKTQQRNIAKAQMLWAEYKDRKKKTKTDR